MRRWIVLLLVLLLPLKSVAAPVMLMAGPTGHAHAAGAAHHDGAGHAASEASAAAHADESHAGCPMFAASTTDAPDNAPHDHPCPHLGMASIATTIGLDMPVSLPHDQTVLPAVRFASITLDVPSPPPTSILA